MPDARGSNRPSPSESARACPFCGGGETELSNTFGAHASVSSWWCRACRSPFEVFKWGTHPGERRDGDDELDGDGAPG